MIAIMLSLMFHGERRTSMAKAVKARLNGELIGRNVTAAMEGAVLVIRVDTAVDGKESKSGKSSVIGSTEGNVPVPHTDLKIGLNVYRPV
jgi:hypothetical protein